MNTFSTYLFTFFCFFKCFSQQQTDSTKQDVNPISYIEGMFGYAGGSSHGVTLGAQINFQKDKSLYTFRYHNQTRVNYDTAVIGFVAIPYFYSDLKIDEYAFLFGRRFIDKNKSYSFSLGLSSNSQSLKSTLNDEINWTTSNYIGVPFELNIKWFKRKKKRFRAYYGLIPIGKETSFGRSFGFKLYGNIGSISYIGLGITFGYGWHKIY
ncbi:hypothetical protein SAMN05421824_0347 [Hyunsoonleella jejuensis]|uniref:Outer membrane protein beta-barrel domain-containing protein n=1 Tax=Hyunsoonleella jejuensis TaxID=419940 RepID=A0A1H9ATN9_9FLAO|nr:hypothetical protein [Hyunsoonleella jejuensis]SEP79895.1 hypothetical protein SAMN05421824_0347 [Hyunsoonleella jejuensis]